MKEYYGRWRTENEQKRYKQNIFEILYLFELMLRVEFVLKMK